jgi:hypothetical protein
MVVVSIYFSMFVLSDNSDFLNDAGILMNDEGKYRRKCNVNFQKSLTLTPLKITKVWLSLVTVANVPRLL